MKDIKDGRIIYNDQTYEIKEVEIDITLPSERVERLIIYSDAPNDVNEDLARILYNKIPKLETHYVWLYETYGIGRCTIVTLH